MTKAASAVIGGLLAVLGLATASAQDTVVVAVPAKAGAVDGTDQNSDEFIWRLLTDFAAPASTSQPSPLVFETWASDEDTFSTTPRWPGPDESKKLHASVLGSMTTPRHGPIDVTCKAPQSAAVGGFPTSGTPTPCIAEEVKRNRPQYDYIVDNNLNTQAGLADAFARSFEVVMPKSSVSVKGDWVPVQMLLQWIPELVSIANIKKLYYTTTSAFVETTTSASVETTTSASVETTTSTSVETTTSGSFEYALVALHVASAKNDHWVWGTFEHQKNPGRCDSIGCFDSFGAELSAVPPNKTAVNTQYGRCLKTQLLKTIMNEANLSPVWANYCLKSTQVDYTAADGTPYVLGNSVIEGIVGGGTISASSCIACHVYASFGSTGTPTTSAFAMLPYNPTGYPIPGVLDESMSFHFTWGVVNAP